MGKKLVLVLVAFAMLALSSMACSNPRKEGGSEANAEAGMEIIIETQSVIKNTADAVYDAVDGAAEAVGMPDNSATGEAIVDASPNLLEAAVELAKRIAKFDACMAACDSDDNGCTRNCEILWAE